MKLITMFTGRNARKGAVYDRTENERNADNPLVWMPESELYKGENHQMVRFHLINQD